MRNRRLLLSAMLGFTLATPKAIASEPMFRDLGADFHANPVFAEPGTRFHESCALNVSHDGHMVVGWTRNSQNNGIEAIVWTERSGLVSLGDFPLGPHHSEAWATTVDGSIVVGFGYTDAGPQAFRWFGRGDLQPLINLAGGVFPTAAYGVSAEGTFVVGQAYNRGCGTDGRAFLWSEASGFVFLDSNPTIADGFRTDIDLSMHQLGHMAPQIAYAVSASGDVVVGRGMTDDGLEAFLWTREHGAVGLGDLPGGEHDSVANAVTSDGHVVVGRGWSENGREAFRWTQQTGMVGLGDLADGAWYSEALAVCDSGSVIVGTSSTMLGNEAFIWRRGGPMRSLGAVLRSEYGLDLDGWTLVSATGTCGLGETVVGWGINPQGATEMWVARMPATPAVIPYPAQPNGLTR